MGLCKGAEGPARRPGGGLGKFGVGGEEGRVPHILIAPLRGQKVERAAEGSGGGLCAQAGYIE